MTSGNLCARTSRWNMTEGAATCIPIALRCVGDAIKLDSENKTKEAYCQYLSCIIYISQVLKDDVWDKDMKLVSNKDTIKLFKLLQQCQERASAIASSTEPTNLQQFKYPGDEKPEQHSQTTPTAPGLHEQYISTGQVSITQTLSDSRVSQITPDTPPTQQLNWSLCLPSPPASSPQTASTCSHGDKFGSLAKSYSDNQRLIVAYRLRMMNSNIPSKAGAGPQRRDTMSKSLSVLRKMSENMAIAQAREMALKKKIEERQERVQEEANRRFGTSTLITKEEQEQRYIYTKIIEFEQETVWPKQLREQLKLNVDDSDVISRVISKIFSCSDHPLTQFLLQYQYHVYRKLSPLVKNVGFPDVQPSRRAAGQESDGQRTVDLQHDVAVNDKTATLDTNSRTEVESDDHATEEDESAVTQSEVDAIDKTSGVIERERDIIQSTECNPEDRSVGGGTPSGERETKDDIESCTCLPENSADENDSLERTSVDLDTSTTDFDKVRQNFLAHYCSNPVENSINSRASESGNGAEQLLSGKRETRVEEDADFHELEADMLDWGNSDEEQSETNDESLAEEDRRSCVFDYEGKPEMQNIKTDENPENVTSTDTLNVPPRMQCLKDNEEITMSGECRNVDDDARQDDSDIEVVRQKLNETLVDIRFFLEKLHKMTLVAFEQLNTPLGRDQCYASLELPFFKPLWPILLAVLRRVNHEKEVQLANVMTEYIVLTPQDIGVQKRLAMENQEVLARTCNKYPYQLAVDELHKVVTYVCPLDKLDGLVRTSRAICQCVEDYWESMGKSRHSSETTIGCDDLLPILTFVIVKSGMTQLVSECNAMEEFIPEGYLMGEEGYCLTSLVTALAYLATLDNK